MSNYRVKRGEQVRFGTKTYTQGQMVGVTKEEAELMPWAVELAKDPIDYDAVDAAKEAAEEESKVMVGEINPRMARKDLNALASTLGIEDPSAYSSKKDLIAAIETFRDEDVIQVEE